MAGKDTGTAVVQQMFPAVVRLGCPDASLGAIITMYTWIPDRNPQKQEPCGAQRCPRTCAYITQAMTASQQTWTSCGMTAALRCRSRPRDTSLATAKAQPDLFPAQQRQVSRRSPRACKRRKLMASNTNPGAAWVSRANVDQRDNMPYWCFGPQQTGLSTPHCNFKYTQGLLVNAQSSRISLGQGLV